MTWPELDNVIGTCSICAGPVVMSPWTNLTAMSITKARCARCGARKKEDYGPVIEMEPQKPIVITTKLNGTE